MDDNARPHQARLVDFVFLLKEEKHVKTLQILCQKVEKYELTKTRNLKEIIQFFNKKKINK